VTDLLYLLLTLGVFAALAVLTGLVARRTDDERPAGGER